MTITKQIDEEGCPPDIADCFAEDDPSGLDCIHLKECLPQLNHAQQSREAK